MRRLLFMKFQSVALQISAVTGCRSMLDRKEALFNMLLSGQNFFNQHAP
jgi:hypothetical protein